MLIIEQTKKTPFIKLDINEKHLIISGRSMPENPIEFYKPLFDKVMKSKVDLSKIDIDLEYFNSTSSKCIYNLLIYIKSNFKKININWYFEEFDDDMIEYIEDISKSVGIKINPIEKINKNENNYIF